MEKRKDHDESIGLYHKILTTWSPSNQPGDRNTFVIEEFGVSANEALSRDMLIKQIVDEVHIHGKNAASQTKIEVFLCYNWKLRLPFVVVKHEVETKETEYTPQYGRDNNYVKRGFSETTYKLCSMDELANRCPEVMSVMAKLN